MNTEVDRMRPDSAKSDDEGGGNFELWTEETVDIETPFSNSPQDDVEYLRLEVAELKQILIALADKFKLSEDKRKVAERRNSFLKADNLRLQQMSDTSLSKKIEAEIENRRTLDKLQEFIDFKQEFEKQAELLKKVISHLPKLKNATTSTCYEMAEKCDQSSGDGCILTERDLTIKHDDPYYRQADAELYQALEVGYPCVSYKPDDKPDDPTALDMAEDGFFESSDSPVVNENSVINCEGVITEDDNKLSVMALSMRNDKEQVKTDRCNTADFTNETDIDIRAWNPKTRKESMSVPTMSVNELKMSKSKLKLSKLKQEVLALKNLNEWKASDLEYKNRQLVVKNRELLYAKKEITQLKMRVNRLLRDQQKRPSTTCMNTPHTKVETKTKPDKVNKVHVKDASRVKICHSKIRIPSDEMTSNKKRQATSEANETSDVDKLPVSREPVWQDIAPGVQVRTKIKKIE